MDLSEFHEVGFDCMFIFSRVFCRNGVAEKMRQEGWDVARVVLLQQRRSASLNKRRF